MISKIRKYTAHALMVAQKKERKTFLPLKNCLTAMIIWCKQFYHLSSLRLLDVYIKLRYWLMPEVVVSDLDYNC